MLAQAVLALAVATLLVAWFVFPGRLKERAQNTCDSKCAKCDKCKKKNGSGGGTSGGSGGGKSGGGGGECEWKSAVATYYDNKHGSRGKGVDGQGVTLTPFRSAAVKEGDWKSLKGKTIRFKSGNKEIAGPFKIEDMCKGGACKKFDLYVGNPGQEKRIPNWQAGNIPVKYCIA